MRVKGNLIVDNDIVWGGSLSGSIGSGTILFKLSSELGSDSGSLTISSIPQTADYLELFIWHKTDSSAEDNTNEVGLRFNGDSGNNYDSTGLGGVANTSTPSAPPVNDDAGDDLTEITLGRSAAGGAAGSSANRFAFTKLSVPGYRLSGKDKLTLGINLCNYDSTGSGPAQQVIQLIGGSIKSDTAISSISLVPVDGQNLVTGTRMEIYGVSGT